MKKMENFDERQLMIRGNIFKHCLITLATLVIIDSFLKDSGIILANSIDSMMIMLMVTATIGSVEMRVKDAYIGIKTNKKVLLIGMAVIGGIGFVALLESGLTYHQLIVRLVTSSCMLIIPVVYVIKYWRERNA